MSTYTNSVGQVLQPGDRVVVIAQGYSHSIKQRVGTFVGVSAAGSPQVRVSIDTGIWVRPDGTVGKWGDDDVKYQQVPRERVSTYYAGRVFKLA